MYYMPNASTSHSISVISPFAMTEQEQQQQKQPEMLKVTVLHYRDRSVDEEAWTKWYIEEQIPRFIPIAHKHGIDRCELVGFICLI